MAAGDLKIYDPDEYTITWNGLDLNSGLADGEYLSIEWDSERFEDVVGVDGEVTRSKSNDLRATVTLKLMMSSSLNAKLQAFVTADSLVPGGTGGIGVFLMYSNSMNEYIGAESSWIQGEPGASYDRTATSREWKIRCAKLARAQNPLSA